MNAEFIKYESELSEKKILLDCYVETRALCTLLMAKGYTNKDEINKYKESVKNDSMIKALYCQIDQIRKNIEYYKTH